MGRITTLIKDGTLFGDLGVTDFGPDKDRAMVCGSIGLNTDIKAILEGYGLREGANSEPAEYVVEKALLGNTLKTVTRGRPYEKAALWCGFSALTLENKGLRG